MASLATEILSIYPDSNYFPKGTSLDGFYIIGIYGRKQTSFSVTVTGGVSGPLTTLMEGISLKHY
jgi:hypothetical protein